MSLFASYPELRRLRKRVVALESKLERERERHLAREDSLLDRCLTGANKYGLAEHTVETPPKQSKPPVRELSAEDEATKTYYKQCARDASLSDEVADEWFAAYLRGEEPVMTEGVQ